DARRVGHMRVDPRDGGARGFQRLAQRLQRGALELRQLVEEENAEMREADLARPAAMAACEAQKKKRPEATSSGYFTRLVRLFHQQCDSLATTDETRFNGFPASFHTLDVAYAVVPG